MPLIRVETNVDVDARRVKETASALSRLAADLLGKPESYVMAVFEPGKALCFGGSHDPAAFVQLHSIGLPEDRTPDFSRELCTFLQSALDVPSERIYIDFADIERHLFGWDGRTF